MNAVNVQLFVLVWTFTAVCQADDDVRVSCVDVTGSVGKEVNLSCRVSLKNTECCIKNYIFKNSNNLICKDPYNNSCKQSDFNCSYTPDTVTERFSFFVQTSCGIKTTEFTVTITDSSRNLEAPGPKDAVIAAVVACFSIVLIIIIFIVTIIRKIKPNFSQSCGFQKRMFFCIKHDEDNTSSPTDVI